MKQFTLILILLVSLHLAAQQTIPLYPAAIPNSTSYPMKEIKMEQEGQLLGYRSISQPTLAVFLPEQAIATGAAVIICPGGGYGMESYRMEGTNIAEAFLKKGIAAFILKYRLPSDSIMPDKSVGPLQDAQQAIKTVRQRAEEWKLNPAKSGSWDFQPEGIWHQQPALISKNHQTMKI